MGHIANWFKINYRGRALLACLIGLVILWSKVSLVTDVIYIAWFFNLHTKIERQKVYITKTLPKMDSNRIKQTKTDTKKTWLSH